MIYTIGNTNTYLKAIAEEGVVFKLGYKKVGEEWHPDNYGTKDYPGGSVFETFEAAEDYLKASGNEAEYMVFGLIADWDQDTKPSTDGNWHDLLIDAKIVVLDNMVAVV